MQVKPTYEELEQRCYAAESTLAAIRSGQTDTVMGEQGLLVLRLAETEKALKLNMVRLGLALEAAQAGTWEWDLRTNENYWSEELWKVYGLEPHSCEPSYEAWRNIIHPEDRASAIQTVQEAAHNGTEFNTEWRVRDADGTERWLMSRGKPLRNTMGEVIRYSGIVLDITDRKRVDEKLKANERALTLFVEYAPAAIAMFDRDMNYIAASRRYLVDYRLRAQNLVGRSHYEVFPEIPERWKEIHRRCLVGAVEMAEEDPFPREDGTLDWVRWEIHPWYENSGEIGGIILFSEVITERHQAKLTLQEREQKLNKLLEIFPVGISILDANRKLVFQNSTLEVILDLTEEGLRKELYQHRQYLAADGTPMEFADFASVQAERSGQAVYNVETGIVKENGETTWVNVSAMPVNFPDWKTVIVTTDITARKQTEEVLRQSEERFRTTLEEMLEGAQIIGFDWRYIYLNATAQTHNRRPNTELLGQRYMEMWPGIEETHVFTLLKNCMETRTAHHFENEFVFPDRTVRWYELSIQPVPEGIFILSIDITERKQIEMQRAQLSERLNLATRSAAIGIWDWDIQKNDLAWDAQMYALYGLKPNEFSGAYEAWLKGLHPEDRAFSNEVSARAVRGESEYNTEFRVLWPDGSVHWLKAHGEVFRDGNGQPLRMVGVNYDITARKRLEVALQTAAQRFQLILASLYGGILVLNNDSQVEFANQAFCDLFDLEDFPKDLLGTQAQEIIRKITHVYADPVHAVARIHEIVAHQQPVKDEEIAIAGGRTYLRDFIPLVIDGQPHGRLWNHIDMTDRKRAEQALRESRELFRKLFNFSPVAYSLLKDGVLLDINPACEAIFGYSKAEVVGKRVAEIDFWVDHREQQKASEMFRQHGELRDFEFAFKTQTGKLGWAISYANLIEQGGENYVLSEFVNITERKELENQLRLNEERLRIAIKPANIILAQTDQEAKYIWIHNPHPDFDKNAILGKTDAELGDNEGTRMLHKVKRQVIQTGVGMQTEISFPVSDGLRSYDFAIEPRYNTGGQVIGATTSAYDITERKKTEEELRRSNAELEQFAYVASHDLQEPLRAVAGMVQLLAQRYKGKLDARADEYIHHAVDASARMQALISDLLDYSRVERFGKSLSPTSAERALNLALKNLQVAIQENQTEITYDPMPMVMADPVQLIQVFQNLIGNALKFHSELPPRIHIGVEKVAEGWRFSVRDNGIGIDSPYFERIFLVFQRLHTRREYPGTGIGLSLCKKIVERHGGQIWVESELGQGATFYFTLSEVKP